MEIVFDLGDRRFGGHDPEEDDRVDVDRDVVTGDHFLRGHIERHDAQVNFDDLIHNGDDEEQPRPFGSLQASQPKDHDALVLPHDLDRVEQEEHADGQHDDKRSWHSETSYQIQECIPSH